MPIDARCSETAQRLEDAFWSRASFGAADVAHASGCADCGELVAALEALADSLAAYRTPPLPTDRALTMRQLAASELIGSPAAARVSPQRGHGLPSGYARELVRILGWALLPLPLALLVYVQMFQFGGELLAQVLPGWGVGAIGIAAICGAASWLAVVYGSIPLVAYRRLSTLDDLPRTPTQVSP